MTVTIVEIAERAGVSPGTVSRVLNSRYKENRPAIAKRAQRIRDIAAELGYRPNAAARSMQTGRFGTMCLVTCGDLGFDWLPLSLLHGLHKSLDERGFGLLVNEVTADQLDSTETLPRIFRESGVDALLINVDSKLPSHILEFFESQPVPGVLLNQKMAHKAVFPDEWRGGWIAAELLAERGRRRVGFFKLDPPDSGPHYSAWDRRDGAVAALAHLGLPDDIVRLGCEEYCDRSGNGPLCAERFLTDHPGIDAVICYELAEAIAISLAASKLGMRVPQDLSVIVFNEREAHGNTSLCIDTMMIPFKAVGEAAIRFAHELVERETENPEALCVPYTQFYDACAGAMVDISARIAGPRP